MTYLTANEGVKIPYGKIRALTEEELASTRTVEYVGILVFENDSLIRIHNKEGYVTIEKENPTYHYYLKDHLGNVRVVIDHEGNAKEINHYYPYGRLFESSMADVQPYKYSEKELETEFDLNQYDFSARWMNPDIGRFTTPDPLAEKYYSISPYVYVANNPMNAFDPDGRDIWKLDEETGEIHFVTELENDHRLYIGNEFIKFKDRDIMDQLTTSRKVQGNRRQNYDGSYAVTSSSEVDDIFFFAADKTKFEWGLAGVNGSDGTQFIIATSKRERVVELDKARRIAGFTEEQEVFHLHSHPGVGGTAGGSDVPGQGGDIHNIREKYGKVGSKLSTHYVYHQTSGNLYQYTPWENSIYIRTIKFKTEGAEIKVQNGLNFLIRK